MVANDGGSAPRGIKARALSEQNPPTYAQHNEEMVVMVVVVVVINILVLYSEVFILEPEK